jgi:hypothetical protein
MRYFMSKYKLKVGYFLLIVAMVIAFAACSSSNDPTDSDELAGTVWISATNLPSLPETRGEYSFASSTKGVWKQKVAGLTVPFTTMNFTYVYKSDKKITITYYEDGGKKEVGTVKGNAMVLTKENGTIINYTKQ